MKLENKVAIVTGGSSGIGYAIVERFVKEGAKVVLCSIDQPSADEAAERIRQTYPGAVVKGIAPTLHKFDEVEKAFGKVYEEFGKIDILVNNAGTSDETAFDQYTEELYDKIFNLNIKGAFACTHAVVKYMEEARQGVIINTSSVAATYGQPKGMAYPASKAAVNGFTLSLARELAKYGIRVNAIAPGITNTTMMKLVPPQYLEPVVQRIPLKRIGEAEDMANAVLFLASDEASYITGTVLSVDGLARF